MLAISLVFGSFLIVMFFILGIVIGWVSREFLTNYQENSNNHQYHPEFFNKEGEFIDQEIVSVRFDPEYFLNGDEESDEEDED